MKLSDTLYEQFTPRERLALFFEAMARKDYPEADRLQATCARKHYIVEDADYLQRLQYLFLLCLYARTSIEESHTRAVAALGVWSAANEKKQKSLRAKAIGAYITATGQIHGIWQAWQEFCGIAGVDPECVMRTCLGDMPTAIENPPIAELNEKIAADPETRKDMLGHFSRMWQRLEEQLRHC